MLNSHRGQRLDPQSLLQVSVSVASLGQPSSPEAVVGVRHVLFLCLVDGLNVQTPEHPDQDPQVAHASTKRQSTIVHCYLNNIMYLKWHDYKIS